VTPQPISVPVPKPVIPSVEKPKKPSLKKNPSTTPVPKLPPPVAPIIPRPVVPPPPPEPAAILEWRGSDTAITHPGQIVIHNDEQWIHFWTEHHPHEVSPDVDFSRYMVVGVFLGARPATLFSVEMAAFHSSPGALVIDYKEIPPPTGTFEVGVTVYPYHLKAIPRSNVPVKFNKLTPQQ
jgi:hypothetical protein